MQIRDEVEGLHNCQTEGLHNCRILPTPREGLGEFETVMQIRDEVKGLHNCRELSQPLECLYQAMQTQEKSFVLLL